MNINNIARKIGGIFFALLVWACFTSNVSAQLLDDIKLNNTKDGKVVAIIALSGQVQYLRHFPAKQGQHLEIYFKIVTNGSQQDPWQGYEARTSPPSETTPGFVVAARDLNTEPKLVIDFSRSANYSVRIGKNARSFVITIQPDKATSTSSKAKPVTEQPVAKNETLTPEPEAKVAVKEPAPVLPVVAPVVVESVAPAVAAPPVAENSPAPTTPEPTVSSPAVAEPAPEAATSVPAAPEVTLVDKSKETDTQAEALMVKGREALKQNQLGVAIESFNSVLSLPPNKFSQDAQEMIGVARENAGQKFKAKLEYEAYLKAYTTGDGVGRVKENLARVSAVEKPVQTAAMIKESKEFKNIRNGSVSMNYYHGNSLTDVSGATSQSGSITDQNMLITSANATERWRNDRYDNRMVFQDTYSKNFLSSQAGQTSPNRLSTLFYDFKDNQTSLSTRVGRQSPTGGGAMGRFDGISGGYAVTPKWQVTAATGQLSDYSTGSKPKFYSVGLAMGNNSRWGGSVYYVNQKTNGISDRSALGGDVRYFDEKKNAFAMVDYDTFFNVVNTVLLQGTMNAESGASYNFSVDHRKTPPISLSNALIGSPYTMQQVLDPNGFGATKDDLKALAIKRTATSNSVSLGVNKQIREKWQAGADVSVSRTSGLPESGTPTSPGALPNWDGYSPATPSSGNNYGLNARLIGNGFFTDRDVSVFSLGYTSSASTKGENFMLSNHLNMGEKWTADSSFRLNWQNSYDTVTGSPTGKVTTISPTIRLGYQVKNNINLEGDAGIDLTNNTPTTGQSSKTTRKYFSLGGRWDF